MLTMGQEVKYNLISVLLLSTSLNCLLIIFPLHVHFRSSVLMETSYTSNLMHECVFQLLYDDVFVAQALLMTSPHYFSLEQFFLTSVSSDLLIGDKIKSISGFL